MQNTVTSETIGFEAVTFEPAVFRTEAALAVQPASRTAVPGWKKLVRTLLLKWDMFAVVALMLASAAYGFYALFFLTGF